VSRVEKVKLNVSLEDFFQVFGVERARRNSVRCFLPGHDDKTPSLMVYPKEDRAWCFGCNRGGDVLDLTALMLSTDIRGAIDFWERRLGLSSEMDTAEREWLTERKERRALEDYVRTWRVRLEQDIPRPLNPDLLSLYDYIWSEKDTLDNLLGRPLEYIREAWRWLFWANDVLNTALKGVRV